MAHYTDRQTLQLYRATHIAGWDLIFDEDWDTVAYVKMVSEKLNHPMPEIKFISKGTTARAWPGRNKLEFPITRVETNSNMAVLHEMAHLLTPGCGHNRLFARKNLALIEIFAPHMVDRYIMQFDLHNVEY